MTVDSTEREGQRSTFLPKATAYRSTTNWASSGRTSARQNVDPHSTRAAGRPLLSVWPVHTLSETYEVERNLRLVLVSRALVRFDSRIIVENVKQNRK
jgi:hypothetical protein